MPVGYGLQAVLAIVVQLVGTAVATPKDEPAQQSADARLARILHEWELHSAKWKSLDVRYSGVETDRAWSDKKPFSGRVVLIRKGRALVEYAPGDAREKKNAGQQRIIWTDDAMHVDVPERKMDIVWAIDAKDRGRLPAVLALPFFWNLTTEGLKSRYKVELVKEERETWYLRITPLPKAGQDGSSAAYIALDRATYLPRRYVLLEPTFGFVSGVRRVSDYRVTDARCDQAVPDEVFRIPSGDDEQGIHITGFETPRFLSRFFSQPSIELIP